MEPTIAIVEPVEPELEERASLDPRVYHRDLERAVCGPWQEGRLGGRWGNQRFNDWRVCSLPERPDFIQMQLSGLDGTHTTLFDPEYLERVQKHTWTVHRPKADLYYAQTGGGRTGLQLHHYLRPDFPMGRKIDHRNRNGKDNRQANLRDGGDGRNENNRGVRSDNKGNLTGVSRDTTMRRWVARIGTPGTDGYKKMTFSDVRHGGREQAYEAACAQRVQWAEEAGNRNGLSPR